MNAARVSRWQIIVNPAAGGRRARARAAAACAELSSAGLAFDRHEPSMSGSVRGLACELAQAGCTHFLAAGGDGTVNAAVNGLHDAGRLPDAVLAALPLGSGNDWARGRGAPLAPRALAEALVRGRLVRCPVGCVERPGEPAVRQRLFVNAAGVGLDVRTIELAPGWRAAWLNYAVGVVRAFARYDALDLDYVADGAAEHRRLLLAMCALGPYSGGGMRLAPHAGAAGRRLALTLIDDLPWWRLLLSGYRLYDGTLAVRPEVHTGYAHAFEVLRPVGEPVQADGDIVARTPVRFSLLETSFRTIAPGP